MRLHFVRETIGGRGCLVANDLEAAEWMARLKSRQIVAMDPAQVRNAKRSALYWVLCGIVADNHPELTNKDAVSHALQILTGCVNVYSFDTQGGRIFVREPKSLAFANMSEDDFERHFEASLRVIGLELLPGCDIEEMRKDAYLASGYREAGLSDSQPQDVSKDE
ncbi:MAG: hypothetical protein KGL39_38125 [Patescibacteria group bacterium]|nr:hypothetical protein [Patescibacteria group bacterium]